MGAVAEYATLEHVAREARPYPVRVFEGSATGLVLFAAAFAGVNDAVHFAEADLETTCVDIDGERLAAMRELYPPDWGFVAADAWTYARAAAREELLFDVVSLDPFQGDAMRRVWSDLEPWTEIARRALVIGYAPAYVDVRPDDPAGWKAERWTSRAPGVYWRTFTRAGS